MKQSSIEKLHAEGSELISRHLNGEISARDLIVMYHNLYYDAQEMHKKEIIEAREDGFDSTYAEYGETPKCYLDGSSEEYYTENFKVKP